MIIRSDAHTPFFVNAPKESPTVFRVTFVGSEPR